jgi:hypothetical protein
MMRGFGEVGLGEQAVEWFRQRLKVYPLSTGPREARFTNATGVGINPLPAEDGSVFEMLNEIIQHEPKELFGAEQLGRLATLGIRKGQPFNPDARMQRILDQGAKQGAAMSRAIVYASREPDIRYWSDRHWEKMFLYNTTFERDGVNDIDARTLWHYQAIVVSPNLLSTTPGAGTAYLTTFRDNNGSYLDGGKTYRLRSPPMTRPPVVCSMPAATSTSLWEVWMIPRSMPTVLSTSTSVTRHRKARKRTGYPRMTRRVSSWSSASMVRSRAISTRAGC